MRGTLVSLAKPALMIQVWAGAGPLEEQVLRVLYEGPCSARECASELSRYSGARSALLPQVEYVLALLVQRGCLRCTTDRVPRYSLTDVGSERLAVLVEAS